MDIDLDHLIFQERTCRVCGKTKSLMEDFYFTRKDRGNVAAAYSYECKECTKQRQKKTRQYCEVYPDW